MKNAQILTALGLPSTVDNKKYGAKLERVCALIADVKKQPWYSLEVGPVVSNTDVTAKVVDYRTGPTYPRTPVGHTPVNSDCYNAEDIINTFPAYQRLTVRYGDTALQLGVYGEYTVDIPANNAFCDYVLQLASHTVTQAPAAAKRAYYRAILPGSVVEHIKTATPYASTDNLRPMMCGVCLDFADNSSVTVVATDAHRLYVSPVSSCDGSSSKNKGRKFVLPTDVCKKLITLKRTDKNEPIELRVYRETTVTPITTTRYHDKRGNRLPEPIEETRNKVTNRLTFALVNTSGGNLSLTGTFMADKNYSKYPDYTAVIPENQQYQVEVDRKTLLSHIAINLPATNKTTKQINFHFNGKVTVNGFDLDFDTESQTEFPHITSNVPEFDISFNGMLLTEVLKGMPDKTVTLHMHTDTRCALISGADSSTRLIMPLYRG